MRVTGQLTLHADSREEWARLVAETALNPATKNHQPDENARTIVLDFDSADAAVVAAAPE